MIQNRVSASPHGTQIGLHVGHDRVRVFEEAAALGRWVRLQPAEFGHHQKAAFRPGEKRVRGDEIERLIALVVSDDAEDRLEAAENLCPCHLRRRVEELFGDWTPHAPPAWVETPAERGQEHLPHTSAQTHIGIAYDSVPYSHPDYFRARAAVGALSDGMSSRFFTEVRENRGLSYAVWATNTSTQKYGAVLCYAGTGADRAQQTLDVMLGELVRLREGIYADELQRIQIRIKSGLVMQQESSPARAASNAGDWYYLGRVQTLDEVEQIIDALTVEDVNNYLTANPPRNFTVVTLGQEALQSPALPS